MVRVRYAPAVVRPKPQPGPVSRIKRTVAQVLAAVVAVQAILAALAAANVFSGSVLSGLQVGVVISGVAVTIATTVHNLLEKLDRL